MASNRAAEFCEAVNLMFHKNSSQTQKFTRSRNLRQAEIILSLFSDVQLSAIIEK